MDWAPTFTRNQADAAELLSHLHAADTSFSPPLSSRVNLADYVTKLLARAERFEAWDGLNLIGIVAAYCNSHAAFISNVSVLPAWQGHGVGRMLMEHCLEHIRRLNLASAALEVSDRAQPALELYRSLGFVPTEAQEPNKPVLQLHLCLTQ